MFRTSQLIARFTTDFALGREGCGHPDVTDIVQRRSRFNADVGKHSVEGVAGRIFSPAKTLAACFR
jgi:hypothetical protein